MYRFPFFYLYLSIFKIFDKMKRFLIVTSLFFGAVMFTSCQKDWICECQYQGEVDTYPIYNKTKGKAKKMCRGDEQIGLITFPGDSNCEVR